LSVNAEWLLLRVRQGKRRGKTERGERYKGKEEKRQSDVKRNQKTNTQREEKAKKRHGT